MTPARRLFAAVVATLILLAPHPADAHQGGGHDYYQSSDGQTVHVPTRGNIDYGRVTAMCRDGSRLFSHHHQGTCSHHGGVTAWR